MNLSGPQRLISNHGVSGYGIVEVGFRPRPDFVMGAAPARKIRRRSTLRPEAAGTAVSDELMSHTDGSVTRLIRILITDEPQDGADGGWRAG
jgi:hypothetical protein